MPNWSDSDSAIIPYKDLDDLTTVTDSKEAINELTTVTQRAMAMVSKNQAIKSQIKPRNGVE